MRVLSQKSYLTTPSWWCQKEIEFETFRKNFTYEEAEEIRIEFEKIVN